MPPGTKKFPPQNNPPIDLSAKSLYPWAMRLSTPVVLALALMPLRAQDDIDAAIQAAQSARNPQTLEQQAATLEGRYQYDSALKLLDAALALRGQVDGRESADYGLS